MNEPIISPWLIYWAGRIEFIQVICCVVGLVVTAFAVTATMAVLTDDYEHDESAIKALKILVCAAVILDTLAVFLPTKNGNIRYVCCGTHNASRHQSNRRIYRKDSGCAD